MINDRLGSYNNMYYNDYYYYYDIIIIEHSRHRCNYNTLYRLCGANITW